MTTDLLFMPTLPQKPLSSFQCDRTGSFSADPSSKTEPPGLSKDDKYENFLTTLKKVSRDRNPSEGSRQPDLHVAARSDKTDLRPKNEQEIDLESADDEALIDIMSLLRNDEASINDQTPVAAELKELITLLEELGLNGSSGERMLLTGAGLAVENMSHPAGKVQDSLAALKQLIAEIQPNDLKPGKDMSTGLERLRQFIANTLAADTSVHSHSIPKDGLNLNQPPGSFDLANWAKGITQGQENATSINGAKAGEVAGGEKSVEILSAMTRAATETEIVSKESGSMKAVGSSQIPLQSENPEKIEAAKLNSDMRAAAAAHETAKETIAPAKGPGNGPVNDDETETAGKAGNPNRNAHFSRSLISADNGRTPGGQPLQENSLIGDSTPVSKLINDAQADKDNPFKANTILTDDSGSKVVKMEAGTNDSGQLTSQTQTSPKVFEMASAAKETEAGQSALRNQTMEQIVRRAVVQVRDGQHEARIDLKPEFLGHVRMQVITENQQVTVKILTEFGFVKDMIENNIHQLKADLQQHGLEVDKVDVSVSRDADGNKHSQQNADRAKNQQHETDHTGGDNTREKNQEPKEHPGLTADGLSTVDYFA